MGSTDTVASWGHRRHGPHVAQLIGPPPSPSRSVRATIHHLAEHVVSRHWALRPGTAGAHQQRELLLCLVWHWNGGYDHPDHRWIELPQLPSWRKCSTPIRAHRSASSSCGSDTCSGSRDHISARPFGSITTGPYGTKLSVPTLATAKGEKLLCRRRLGQRIQRSVSDGPGRVGDAPGSVQL
jgi:hypothetical protein